MFNPFNAPHYRAVFRIKAPLNSTQLWTETVETLFSWLAQSRNIGNLTPQLNLERFAQSCDEGAGRHRLRSAREQGAGSHAAPQYWAMRFEHPDSQLFHRSWRTDIGLTLVDDGILDFSLALAHSLHSEYVGEPPPLPSFTRPVLLRLLLDRARDGWSFLAGDTPLANVPIPLCNDAAAEAFWRSATDRARTCPLVLLMPDREHGHYALDADRLANLLTGVASVFVADRGAYYELLKVMPELYQCYWQYVRIYSPGLTPENSLDFRRHRWFSHDHVARETAERVEEIIVQSLVRSEARTRTPVLTTLEDVAARRIEFKLQQLQAQSHTKAASALEVQLLWEDNERLNQKVSALEAEIDQYVAIIEEREQTLEEERISHHIALDAEHKAASELREEIIKLTTLEGDTGDRAREREYQLDTLNRSVKPLKEENEQLRVRAEAIAALAALPATLREVVDTIEKLHAGRIVFTDRARASVKVAHFEDINGAWKCLYTMATKLWTLYFDPEERVSDVRTAFEAVTKYGLSLSEGENTNKNERLKALRYDSWQGEQIDIAPHVSIGTKNPDLLRVHYYAHQGKKLIVVGHCGDHIETAGSRRRKEK